MIRYLHHYFSNMSKCSSLKPSKESWPNVTSLRAVIQPCSGTQLHSSSTSVVPSDHICQPRIFDWMHCKMQLSISCKKKPRECKSCHC
ncbi:unnamed protein product [Musa acuminata subsp. malaccensis]|uniref:(wild Malaysian banana) hypothetical protein n=1 Tax=Musa acuminata subsp. malaccensis TaxID=214687 RepID=A0A804IU57_MUSAM|nr:unnamed protein product [Musa acuminata subsp. malaccensis]